MGVVHAAKLRINDARSRAPAPLEAAAYSAKLESGGPPSGVSGHCQSDALTPAFFNPRLRSLPRGNVLVLACLALSLPLSHFPHLRPNYWLTLPLLGVGLGTLDTMRCMRKRWDFYHGGVILCIYMDLMVMVLVLFLLLYPALL